MCIGVSWPLASQSKEKDSLKPKGKAPTGGVAGSQVNRRPASNWEYRILNNWGACEIFCFNCSGIVRGELSSNGKYSLGPFLCGCGKRAYLRQEGLWYEVS